MAVSPHTKTIGANLTVTMPGDHDHILSMYRFRGMTKHVSSRNESIKIGSHDNNTFDYAKQVWVGPMGKIIRSLWSQSPGIVARTRQDSI